VAVQETDVLAALDLLTSPAPQKVSTDGFSAERLSAPEKRRLTKQVRQTRAWSIGGNVVGYGITEKHAGEPTTGNLALTVYVKKKYPKALLDESQLVPPSLALEGLDATVPTDVQEIGELRLEALSITARPIPGGYSIGPLSATGTYGCLVVERGEGGRRLVLSNSHVLAASGTGRPGDVIYQPGPDERDTTMEVVAKLLSWQPFDFGADYTNRFDAALAEPIKPEWFDTAIYHIGKPVGIRPPARGMMIHKSGRTSGYTMGRVLDVHYRTALQYPRPDGQGLGEAKFRDQVLCTRYSEPGDSGALVLDTENYAVGLHFCGGPGASVFSPIQFVLDDLGVDLVTA
jgi:hypothetical protein